MNLIAMIINFGVGEFIIASSMPYSPNRIKICISKIQLSSLCDIIN